MVPIWATSPACGNHPGLGGRKCNGFGSSVLCCQPCRIGGAIKISGQGCNPPPAGELHLINPWLLGEKYKPIITRDAGGVIRACPLFLWRACPWHDIPAVFQSTKSRGKAVHFVFPTTIADSPIAKHSFEAFQMDVPLSFIYKWTFPKLSLVTFG
jgi:hypothetical protein